MNSGIALLGWGSLLWDGGEEFDLWHGPWFFDGPALSIEFSRISKSRQGALTLVLDPEHGMPNQVAYCVSKRHRLSEAIEDLRRREVTAAGRIGAMVVPEEPVHEDDVLAARAVIRGWGLKKGLYAVVWTDLRSNFAEQLGQPFSIDAALEYLKALPPASQQRAAEYFHRAPSFIRTRLRDAVRAVLWPMDAAI